MKFVELKSRGGNYFVVAANIAYLRVDENGQTKVGLIGGDSLLVVGSMTPVGQFAVNKNRTQVRNAAEFRRYGFGAHKV